MDPVILVLGLLCLSVCGFSLFAFLSDHDGYCRRKYTADKFEECKSSLQAGGGSAASFVSSGLALVIYGAMRSSPGAQPR